MKYGEFGVTWKEAVEGPSLSVELEKPCLEISAPMVYKQCFGELKDQLFCQIISPEMPSGDKGPFPCVVYVASGGFSKSNVFTADLSTRCKIAEAGYVVATLNHRIGIAGTKWPDPLEDLKEGVRWLRHNAEKLNIRKERMGAIGGSAGGYFASMLGVTSGVDGFDKGDYLEESSSIQAVVDLFGPSDLTMIGAGLDEAYPDAEKDLGVSFERNHLSPATPESLMVNGPAMGLNSGGCVFDTPETAFRANPLAYVSSDTPPFLIFHGECDDIVSPVATELLHRKLASCGVDSSRFVISGAGHGGIEFEQPAVLNKVTDFFNAHLL